MARVTYGSIVTEINGSLGGHTYQRNRFGHTAKNKPLQPRPNNNFQQSMQQFMGLVTQTWKELGEAVQTNWKSYASTYPQFNPNSTVALNGFQVFCRFNLFQLSCGRGMLTGIISIPPVTSPYSPAILSDNLDVFQVNPQPTTVISGHVLAIYVSQAMSNVSAPSNFKKRFMSTASPTNALTDVSGMYIAKYGAIGKVNDYVRLWLIEFDATSPFLHAAQEYTVQVQSV
jgi:hypothetical protein